MAEHLNVERVDELRVELVFMPGVGAPLGDLERFVTELRRAGALSQLSVKAELTGPLAVGPIVLRGVQQRPDAPRAGGPA